MLPRLVALWIALALAGPVHAEAWQFEGTFSIGGIADPAPVGTAIGVATVNGSGVGPHVSSLQVPGGLISIQSSTTPDVTTFTRLIVSMTPGAGSFAGGSGTGTLAGALPVPGNVRLCLIGSCAFFFDIPFTENGTRGVGLGGTITRSILGGTLSLVGAQWGDVTATVTGTSVATSPGFAHGPVSLTSSTAQTSGVLQMVTPVQVGFSVGGDPPVVIPMFGSYRIRFLPEPATFASLACGALALACLGARRYSSRASPRRSGGT